MNRIPNSNTLRLILLPRYKYYFTHWINCSFKLNRYHLIDTKSQLHVNKIILFCESDCVNKSFTQLSIYYCEVLLNITSRYNILLRNLISFTTINRCINIVHIVNSPVRYSHRNSFHALRYTVFTSTIFGSKCKQEQMYRCSYLWTRTWFVQGNGSPN